MRKLVPALALHLVLAIGAVATLLPFAWMVSASLMHRGEASKWPPSFLPSRATFENYRELFERLDIGRCFLNSMFVAVVSTALALLIVAAARGILRISSPDLMCCAPPRPRRPARRVREA